MPRAARSADDAGNAAAIARARRASFWLDELVVTGVDSLAPRPALTHDAEFDVCIVGGGLTALWTAYSLTETAPGLRIAVVEREIVGYGASGRNGGWCSALFPRSTESLVRAYGHDAALAMRRAIIDTVDEVGRVAEREGIECAFAKGGTLVFARSEVQRRTARADVAAAAAFGVDEVTYIEADDLAVSATSLDGHPVEATRDANCARVNPAKLVRGLARVVEARGVSLFEQSEVIDWSVGSVRVRSRSPGASSAVSMVRAQHVLIATEGYTPQFRRTRRRLMPIHSLVIATEPLDDTIWREIGISHGQTFSDYRHLLIYGQRTADNRFLFGGRGATYGFGSAIRDTFGSDDPIFAHLKRELDALFPVARAARVTHRWGGPLGVARDWHPTVSYNPASGVGFAGGYVGDGISTTNLAGRTMSDLILGRNSALTALPWVNHRSPLWEPEPFRFLGANVGILGTGLADREEQLTQRSSLIGRAVGRLTGH
ncbi:MAG TPA: FAD-binding oxidoreductase [Candidatus Lumbricidophila sp.]|nr:FAD-binding oxidoreductase [Candidatus Lumbricidophila sp.]